jgi:opacity protein-like surface antigen
MERKIMMKGELMLVAGLCLVATSKSALAVGEGFYIEGNVGRQTAVIPSFSIAGWATENKATTYALGGGFNFNRYFGIEVGYQNLGKVAVLWTGAGTVMSGSNLFVGGGGGKWSADVDGYYVGPTVSFPINDQYALTGRAGWYRWKADLKLTASPLGILNGTPVPVGSSVDGTNEATDTYVGLGVSYKVNKNVGVNLGYAECKGVEYKTKNVTLGARYSF